jgi:hypothetical protein
MINMQTSTRHLQGADWLLYTRRFIRAVLHAGHGGRGTALRVRQARRRNMWVGASWPAGGFRCVVIPCHFSLSAATWPLDGIDLVMWCVWSALWLALNASMGWVAWSAWRRQQADLGLYGEVESMGHKHATSVDGLRLEPPRPAIGLQREGSAKARAASTAAAAAASAAISGIVLSGVESTGNGRRRHSSRLGQRSSVTDRS